MFSKTDWMPQVRVMTRQQDRERADQQELEETVRLFLVALDWAVDQPTNPKTDVLDDHKEEFVGSVSDRLARLVSRFTDCKEEDFVAFVRQLLGRVKELPLGVFRQTQEALAGAIVERVLNKLGEPSRADWDTIRLFMHVAIQSLRAALAKPR